MVKYTDYLARRAYPGRGILLGASACGRYAIAAYFLMGRSPASRARVLLPTKGGAYVAATDSGALQKGDPALLLYTPVQTLGEQLIVANGDHSDTMFQTLQNGGTLQDALITRTYEPDAPHYTPRIAGLMRTGNTLEYELGILYKAKASGGCVRTVYRYNAPQPGTGHLLHTYSTEENGVLQPFAGAPVELAIPDTDAQSLADGIWEALDASNRVALYVQYSPLQYSPLQGSIPETAIHNQLEVSL